MISGVLVMSLTDTLRAVSPDELKKIEQAAPAKPTMVPKQPRKLLVFSKCGPDGYKHSSIPYCDAAMKIMGSKTGAFEAVISYDEQMLLSENLAHFDAICFNNTTHTGPLLNEAMRKGLMDFVKSGKGVVGIHAATDNFYDFPEAAEMMGGLFRDHPWGSGGTWAVKLDDPGHPLLAAFGGEGFKIKDEIYRLKAGSYSRENQRVLMVLDMDDPATRGVKGIDPAGEDIAISWVRDFGKGRVFYCSLGHNHEVYWNSQVLRHYLDGIQFALGDMPVDTCPLGATVELDSFMGDWQGSRQTVDGSESTMVAQVISLGDSKYRINIFERFDYPYGPDTVLEAVRSGDKVSFTGEGNMWSGTGKGTIKEKTFKGTFEGDDDGEFKLEKVVRLSPNLGMKPPAGAVVLFDGKNFNNWQTFDDSRCWVMDLSRELGGENCVAFLRNEVWSEKKQKALLEMGSDDGLKVYLNGKVVYEKNVIRGFKFGEDRVVVTLEQGWNELMLKVTQGNGGWAAAARVLADDAKPLKDVKFKLNRDVSGNESQQKWLKANPGFATAWEVLGPLTQGNRGPQELFEVEFGPGKGAVGGQWKLLPKPGDTRELPVNWKLVEGGAMEVGSGSIVSKAQFRDHRLHLEFRTPFMPKAKGQKRGNSGVYIQGRYEIQVLDSYGLPGRDNECGGIYKAAAPLINMCAPPLQWQSYDVEFYAPRLNAEGAKVHNARITVVHNGVPIHENLEIPDPTPGGVGVDEPGIGGLFLQDHSNKVQFRNIWIQPLN